MICIDISSNGAQLMPVKGAVSHLFHNLIYAISARQPEKRASGGREWKDLITTPLINKKNISVAQKERKKTGSRDTGTARYK
jgi:hypothetical protein